MADDPQMQKLAERLNSINGAWRPLVLVGLLATGGGGSALTWKFFDFQSAYYRGQELQNERLSELEAQQRAQDQFVNLAELLQTVRRTEFKVGQVDEQIADLRRQLTELAQQRRELNGPLPPRAPSSQSR